MMPFERINGVDKIGAVAFDLDGTLVDSVPGLCQGINQMLRQFDLPVAEPQQVALWIGNGADILVARALRWALNQQQSTTEPDSTQYAEARRLFDAAYQQSVFSGSHLFPGVQETLLQLAEHQIPMALVTNKPTPFVAPLLAALSIDRYFSLIVGGDDTTQKKPHPAPLYLVLGRLGLRASELLFVGDSRNDIGAAQAAGCLSVGVSYGYNYGEDIALSHPDGVLACFTDLLPLLGLHFNEQEVST